MTPETDTTAGTDAAATAPPAGWPARWTLATLAGILVSLPFGWLLATAAMLPFYLGLFFFALFGLVIGAVLFRVARPAVPIARPPLIVGGMVTVVATLAVSIVVEHQNLFGDAVRKVRESYRMLTEEELARIEVDTPAEVREYLARHYPPGGPVGYLRWARQSGRMELQRTPHGRTITFLLRQRPLGWTLRVTICAGLLTFGVMSQVLTLANPRFRPADGNATDALPLREAPAQQQCE